ncbi:MAG: hypothetical protein M5U08_14025 [Burkholderiales bacterium]|nr:hypothetical protein [Burkholderiales bacterium]
MTFLDRWLRLVDRVATIAVWSGGALLLAGRAGRRRGGPAQGAADLARRRRRAVGLRLRDRDQLGARLRPLLRRAHVRVDRRLLRACRRAARRLDLVALVAMASFAVLTQRAAAVLGDSLAFAARATTPLATPLWIPQAMARRLRASSCWRCRRWCCAARSPS